MTQFKKGDRVAVHSAFGSRSPRGTVAPRFTATFYAETPDEYILTDPEKSTSTGFPQDQKFGLFDEDLRREGNVWFLRKALGGTEGGTRKVTLIENPRGEYFAIYNAFCDQYGLDRKDRELRHAINRLTGNTELSAARMTDTQFKIATQAIKNAMRR